MNETLETHVNNLTSELERSSRKVNKLTAENETFDIQVKNLLRDLEFSKSQHLAFSSGSKKLDNILGMSKSTDNREGLGFNENTTSTPASTFVFATDQPKHALNPEPKIKGVVG